jgi:predicted DNA-binding ribbon-helix-helix protein
MRLEHEFWDALSAIAAREGLTAAKICTTLSRRRGATGLSSAVRVAVLAYFRFHFELLERQILGRARRRRRVPGGRP